MRDPAGGREGRAQGGGCAQLTAHLPSRHRHVKGRVLVALADGTLAIFHRGEGETWFGDAGGLTSLWDVTPPCEQRQPSQA